jgi:hypothetical protein
LTVTNGYTTLALLRARLGFASTDTTDDTMLETIIMAVSRWIDHRTGRRFFSTTVSEIRYYTAEWSDLFQCPDDIINITTLATDGDGDRVYETTWAVTDYDLEPVNASLDSQPYTRLRITPAGRYSFPVGVGEGVKIMGKFGYGATAPGLISEACLLQSERVYKRKDAPFGVLGAAEMGQMMVVPKLDPDVDMMLAGFRRLEIGAA